jgi:hypothetical protein
MPPLQTLAVVAVGAPPGAGIVVTARGDSARSWYVKKKLGEDGVAVFPTLPPGTYRVSVNARNLIGDTTVTIPGPAEVALKVRPGERADRDRE